MKPKGAAMRVRPRSLTLVVLLLASALPGVAGAGDWRADITALSSVIFGAPTDPGDQNTVIVIAERDTLAQKLVADGRHVIHRGASSLDLRWHLNAADRVTLRSDGMLYQLTQSDYATVGLHLTGPGGVDIVRSPVRLQGCSAVVSVMGQAGTPQDQLRARWSLSCDLTAVTRLSLTAPVRAALKEVLGTDRTIRLSGQGPFVGTCFTGATVVATATGLRPIQEIREGDMVWARDEGTGDVALRSVTKVFRHVAHALRVLDLGLLTIETTDEHPFWVEDKGWVNAGEIEAGDRLRTRRGDLLPVLTTTREERVTPVYNIEVDGFHTFFVTEESILVHNKG